VAVGSFACDVVAHEVGTGHKVIIENQLEPTDHSHLGQVLTYTRLVWTRGRSCGYPPNSVPSTDRPLIG